MLVAHATRTGYSTLNICPPPPFLIWTSRIRCPRSLETVGDKKLVSTQSAFSVEIKRNSTKGIISRWGSLKRTWKNESQLTWRDTFVEIRVLHEALRQAEFHLEGILQCQAQPFLQLPEGDFHRQWGLHPKKAGKCNTVSPGAKCWQSAKISILLAVWKLCKHPVFNVLLTV